MAENKDTRPLGKILREISESFKSNIELEQLGEKLIELAKAGNTRVKFTDLRTHIPNIVTNGGIEMVQAWADKNEIKLTGAINSNTSAWEYTISWED